MCVDSGHKYMSLRVERSNPVNEHEIAAVEDGILMIPQTKLLLDEMVNVVQYRLYRR